CGTGRGADRGALGAPVPPWGAVVSALPWLGRDVPGTCGTGRDAAGRAAAGAGAARGDSVWSPGTAPPTDGVPPAGAAGPAGPAGPAAGVAGLAGPVAAGAAGPDAATGSAEPAAVGCGAPGRPAPRFPCPLPDDGV